MKELVASIAEHGDHVYITTPVHVIEPDESEIETFAFASSLRSLAPNPKIMWLGGRYVEADNPNSNGDQWTAGELAIKSLTPVLMPITVMHDLRTAVGTIADTKLRVPAKDDVPRARIETALALWAHRFPDVAEEAQINAQQGTLMQSMECVSPTYDCSVCGQMYQRLPHGKERDHWCSHLRGEGAVDASGEHRAGARILRSVVFTGTGLIFGTRGARGAYREAHLEVEELAELHAKAHTDTARKRSRRTNFMELEDARYAELVAAEQKLKTLEPELDKRDKAVQDAEAAKVAAEEQRDKEKQAREEAEEKARVAALRDERLESLGSKFTNRLEKATTTFSRLKDQAGKLSDDDWKARLEELGEAFGVKADANFADGEKPEDEGSGEGEGSGSGNGSGEETAGLFTQQEVTASRVGGGGNGSGSGSGSSAPSVPARQSVIGGLVRRPKAGASK